MIKRFDLVRLKTIQNIAWVSGPQGRPASPQGIWSVVAGVDTTKLMLAKDETVIQIPMEDVVKVADYGIEHVMERIKQARTRADLDKFMKPSDAGEENCDVIEG